MKKTLLIACAFLGIAVAYAWYTHSQVSAGPVIVDAVGFFIIGA